MTKLLQQLHDELSAGLRDSTHVNPGVVGVR